MAESTVPKVRRDGTLVLDWNSGANTYTVAYEDGDVSLNESQADEIVIRDRGTITNVRKGDDPVFQISFTVHAREFTNGSTNTLIDALLGSGNVSGDTKADSRIEHWNTNATLTVEGTNHGDAADHTIKANGVVWNYSFAEGDPDSISVTGNVYFGFTKTGIS